MEQDETQSTEKISYWEVFFDDIFLLFFLGVAIPFVSFTIWGLMELSSADVSPLVKPESVAAAPKAVAKNYWADWAKGKAQGPMPDCDVNVLALGGDDILQATVETYCGVKPGSYTSKINPAAMEMYKNRGSDYPDGRTAVLIFREIGVFFTTDHKNGEPIYNVLKIEDETSVASNEPGHPLNPETCAKCHAGFEGVCKGYVCGNRF